MLGFYRCHFDSRRLGRGFAGCGKSGAGLTVAEMIQYVSETVDYLIVAADGLSASAARYRDFRKAAVIMSI